MTATLLTFITIAFIYLSLVVIFAMWNYLFKYASWKDFWKLFGVLGAVMFLTCSLVCIFYPIINK